jgi:TetR/AcrR family transcriptional regulator, fatty acid metabolism regulator protein
MPKKKLKRQLIIDAAIEIFSRNGFQNSTISQIARKANVAEGTIYQYFRNKEDLFFSIPIDKTTEFYNELELHLEGIHGAENKIRKFVWYYLYHLQENPEYARALMLEMRVNRNFARAKAFEAYRPLTHKILQIIEGGQEEGIIRKDVSVYTIRHLILGVLEHIVTRWLLKGEKGNLLDQYSQAVELLIQGIREPEKRE